MGLRYYENSINKSHKSQHYLPTAPASIGQRAPDDILVPFTTPTLETSVSKPELLATLEGDSIDKPRTTRLYELLAFPGVFNIIAFAANRLVTERDFEAGLVKDIDHYQQAWLSKWPGLGGVLDANSTPQFMVHVISSVTPSSFKSGNYETTTREMANRTAGFGKIYKDCEGGRLHERYGFAGVSTKKGDGGGVVVLRPDTHIAFRVSNVNCAAWADVDEYFQSVLTAYWK